MSKKRSERRRRGRKRFWLLLVPAAIAVLWILFPLRTVVVSGNIHNPPADITELLLEKPTGGNTLLAWFFNRKRRITSPGFIESLHTEITGRDSLRVEVTERPFVGRTEWNGSSWYYDSSGTVMAQVAIPAEGEWIPRVTGLDPAAAPALGEVLGVPFRNCFSMLGVLRSIYEADPSMAPDLVEFDSKGDMTAVYGDVRILLGDGEKLEMRVRKMAEVLPVLREGYRGTLHLEGYDGSQSGLIFDKEGG